MQLEKEIKDCDLRARTEDLLAAISELDINDDTPLIEARNKLRKFANACRSLVVSLDAIDRTITKFLGGL